MKISSLNALAPTDYRRLKTVDTKFGIVKALTKLRSHDDTKNIKIIEDLTEFRDKLVFFMLTTVLSRSTKQGVVIERLYIGQWHQRQSIQHSRGIRAESIWPRQSGRWRMDSLQWYIVLHSPLFLWKWTQCYCLFLKLPLNST